MGGHRYTYFCQAEPKLSKLDRFLLSPSFINRFPNTSVTALPRELSDHCPVLLRSTADYGKTPFRLFNSWMMRDEFELIVSHAWSSFVGYGAPDSYLAAKLKYLKNEIKRWRAFDFPNEVAELKRLKQRIHAFDLEAESRELNGCKLSERQDGLQKIAEIERMALDDLKQKARIKWVVDGDENTRFFHGFMNNNR
uniref:Endonuclease/exonuclease/phosphatase domain-containing protein n=1 Tax=Lactuca sativa TaxID=4236 RepID=A0A9R1X9R2_LACSA|nr:hypothetical protein LSAT_V11C500288120 [Lactuca sativa]